jgi:predicted metal-dependent peptidase
MSWGLRMFDFKYTVEEKVKRQIISLQQSHPFWAYLVLRMKIIEGGDDMEFKTACVSADGTMWYNKEFFDSLSADELKGVIAHEVGHLAFGHLLRVGTRDRKLWNIVIDALLNDILLKNNFTLPSGVITLKKGNFEMGGAVVKDAYKMSAERLYDELLSQADKLPKQYGFDMHKTGEELSPGQKDKLEGEWKQAIASAATHAKMRGLLPVGVDSLIGDILDPKISWKQYLLKYVKSSLPYDITFSKPNKKFLSQGIILPGVVKENMDIVIALDTSGSISDTELQDFLTEMKGIARSHNNVKMTVIQADAEVQDVCDITSRSVGELLDFKLKGRGGTSHKPVFKYIEENIVRCKLLVAFTDGYSDIQDLERPAYNVMWAVTKGGKSEDMHFGEVIEL